MFWLEWSSCGRPMLRAGGLLDQPAALWRKLQRIDQAVMGLFHRIREAETELKQQEVAFETAFNNLPTQKD